MGTDRLTITTPWHVERTFSPAEISAALSGHSALRHSRVTGPVMEGWECALYAVDGPESPGLLVRVPKRRATLDLMRQEAALLAEIAPNVPFRVPVPLAWIALGDGWQATLIERMPGVSLTGLRGKPVDAAALGTSIGLALRALHSLRPMAARLSLDAEVMQTFWQTHAVEPIDQLASQSTMAHAAVAHLASSGTLRALRQWADRGPPEPAGGRDKFCHFDLYGDHVFVDPLNSCLTAVVDWTDAGVGPAQFDFADIALGFGDAFLDSALRAYGDTDPVFGNMIRSTALAVGLEAIVRGLEGAPNTHPDHTARLLVDRVRDDWAK